MPLPNVAKLVFDQAGKQKDMLVAALAKEFSKFLQKMDLGKELKELLEDTDVEVHATLRFKRRGSEPKKSKHKS